MNIYDMVKKHLPKEKTVDANDKGTFGCLSYEENGYNQAHQEIIEVLKRCELNQKVIKNILMNKMFGSLNDAVTRVLKAITNTPNIIKLRGE